MKNRNYWVIIPCVLAAMYILMAGIFVNALVDDAHTSKYSWVVFDFILYVFCLHAASGVWTDIKQEWNRKDI